MERRRARALASPPPGDALARAVAASDPDSEVQCPRCGWCSRWPAVDDDRPTVTGLGCPRCGATWDRGRSGEGPDVVVDAAKTATTLRVGRT